MFRKLKQGSYPFFIFRKKNSMGNFSIFESAVSALRANSQSISVAANNIANVNTPGYSRQKVILASPQPQFIGGLEVGRGVDVKAITRTFDRLAELRLRSAAGEQAQTDVRAGSLQQVQEVFNEIAQNGLSSFTTDFFNAFHDVSTEPESITNRQNLMNKAGIMISQFHNLAGRLRDMRNLIDEQIKDKIKQVNDLAEQIHDLNLKIQSASGDAMSLRDERQLRVKDLAELVDVTALENKDGDYQVYIASGLLLVNNKDFATLSTQSNSSNAGLSDIYFTVGSGSPANVTSRIGAGALKGLLDVRDYDVPIYQERLDEFAYQISKQVNDLHTSGYDLDGNTLNEFFNEEAFNTQSATSSNLVTDLKNASGNHLRIRVGDVIQITGDVGATGITGQSLTVTATTTLADIAAALQSGLRSVADGTLTETATVQPDGSIRVTSDATHAITNLQLSISGNTAFNTAFTYASPIAAGGATDDSDTLTTIDFSNASELIDLDSSVDGQPRAIAASSAAGGVPGGNDLALSLADLQNTNVNFASGETTFIRFYDDLLAKLGSDAGSAKKNAQFSNDILQQAQIQREQISGVSIDDEQIDLMRFQSAFQAASKLVSVADDLLSILVKLGG